MASPMDITVEQAREIVLIEARRRGWVRPHLLQSQDQDTQELMETLRMTRESLGDAVDIIARGIYSTRGRFILELIQNIEDCEFNHAATPFVGFELDPEKIIVESNQDGFNAVDVGQICHTGNSWKRGRRGYVGEKGIGFKSVFKVASKVDIQSNAFSFSFEYNGGPTSAEKLGMITPIVGNNPIPQHERPLTRMTLTSNHTASYSTLVSDFDKIPEAILLFLTKLKVIRIKIHSLGQVIASSKKFRISAELDGPTTIHVSNEENNHARRRKYYVRRTPITDLPNDSAREGINECDGVLAFPIDEEGLPRTHTGYDVYAFLPVCRVGFNFLIQADFLLQASRQELILESDWNLRIIDELALEFCNAIAGFSTMPSLRFRWMRFLPVGREFEINTLWRQLSRQIIHALTDREILYAHNNDQVAYVRADLRRPRDLRTLPPACLDEFRLPLFADLSGRNRIYLSTIYSRDDFEVLQTAFRIPVIADIAIISRIKQDLESPTSKMRDPNTTEDWHSRAANLIAMIWDRSPDIGTRFLNDLPLIPLSDGRWVSSLTRDLRFPAQIGPTIPTDLVTTVDFTACMNVHRRALFVRLGVEEILPTSVIGRIWAPYARNHQQIDLAVSISHLKYLYWHHPDNNDARFSRLWIYDSSVRKIDCRYGLIYFPYNDDFGPQELLKAVPRRENPQQMVPACSVSYLHPDYLQAFPENTRRRLMSWHDWLENALTVRRIIRFKATAGSLSQEFRHIIAYRPEKIVGLLKTHWGTYRMEEMSRQIKKDISRAEVTCQNNSLALLETAYFPLPNLIQNGRNIRLPATFPFLRSSLINQEDRNFEDWRFLERFGVNFECTLTFYLDGLRCHSTHMHLIWDNETRNGIVKAYEHIADHCNEIHRHSVVSAFEDSSLVLHPDSFHPASVRATWINPRNCVWRGPPNSLLRKVTLATAAYRNNQRVTRLICEILEVRNSDWYDYLDRLLEFSRGQNIPLNLFDKVKELYILLSEQQLSNENRDSLFDDFENNGLIYIPSSHSWISPSVCIWESPVAVPGKFVLNTIYSEDLRDFFQDRFDIHPAAVNTLVEGLRALAGENPSLAGIKDMIKAINEMIPTEQDLVPLLSQNVLPVGHFRGGPAFDLQSSQDNFAINDRKRLAVVFRNHATLLDFSLEEVNQLHPFISALGLEKKFISRISQHETACGGGILDVHLTENFQQRAYDLLRCAVSHRSPLALGNIPQLYTRLASITILRSALISTQHSIRYENGETVGPVSQNTGSVHIQEQGNSWQIFVPQNRGTREVCYMKHLPVALAKLFRIDQAASETIGHVLKSSIGVINAVLEDGGVGEIADFERPLRIPLQIDDSSFDSDEESIAIEVNRERQIQRTPSSDDSREASQARSLSGAPVENRFVVRNVYRELLDNIIRIAPNIVMPRMNAVAAPINNNAHHAGFEHNAAFGVRSQGQMNHDVKIGAAGELFVYEFLKTLNLSSFEYQNWTSTIRQHVLVHPNYQNMGAWRGRRETSDIRYQDTQSILTRHLITAGYLNAQVWNDTTPEYMIEVKATTGELADRFFMSSNQVRLMQTMALTEGQTSERIYVIFRVYNLGRESLGFQIYVDPESHRGRDLAFAEHTWTVTPI